MCWCEGRRLCISKCKLVVVELVRTNAPVKVAAQLRMAEPAIPPPNSRPRKSYILLFLIFFPLTFALANLRFFLFFFLADRRLGRKTEFFLLNFEPFNFHLIIMKYGHRTHTFNAPSFFIFNFNVIFINISFNSCFTSDPRVEELGLL